MVVHASKSLTPSQNEKKFDLLCRVKIKGVVRRFQIKQRHSSEGSNLAEDQDDLQKLFYPWTNVSLQQCLIIINHQKSWHKGTEECIEVN